VVHDRFHRALLDWQHPVDCPLGSHRSLPVSRVAADNQDFLRKEKLSHQCWKVSKYR
jgi:hypothetical protein